MIHHHTHGCLEAIRDLQAIQRVACEQECEAREVGNKDLSTRWHDAFQYASAELGFVTSILLGDVERHHE